MPYWDLLVIFLAQVIYVSTMTLRWIILFRGSRFLASAISFFEVLIYIYALSLVVTQLGEPTKLVMYALGYAMGSLIGSWLEERLAFGYSTVQLVTKDCSNLAEILRERGFGVTAWNGEGRHGPRKMAFVVLRRKHLPKLYRLVDEYDPKAFVLNLEPKGLRGGFLVKRLV